MKVALLYFTGTGTTAKFAEDIAEGFKKEKNWEVTLFRIKKGARIDLSSFDLLGLGAPAYSFCAPRFALKFIRRLDLQKKPFFVFCTSGGMPGNTLWDIYRVSKRSAGTCLGYIDGVGTTNIRSWMPRSNSRSSIGKLREYDCSQAKQFAGIVLKRLASINKDGSEKDIRSWKPKAKLAWALWFPFFTLRFEMASTVGLKRVDKDKCTKCKLCATAICPSGAITLREDNTPKISELACVGCNGCVNLCPVDAIWTLQTKNHLPYDVYKKYILKK